MAKWRIELTMPDGTDGHLVLSQALAAIPAARLQPAPRSQPLGAGQVPAGLDLVVDLREESSLPDLLHMLHEISPRVSISRGG